MDDPGGREAVVAAWLCGFGAATRDAYRRDYERFERFCDTLGRDTLTATRALINAFHRHIEEVEHLSGSTRARILSALSSFYGYAVDEGYASTNPVANVRRPKVDNESTSTGLAKGESHALFDVAARDGARSYALVRLLAHTGLRISEALNLTKEDFRVERGHPVCEVTRKGGKRQLIPLPEEVVVAMGPLLAVVEGGPVFRGTDGRQWNRGSAWRVVKRLAQSAGIPEIGPHGLRHTFVTLALEAGIPLHEVQDAAGHADPRTTQRYNRARHRLDNAPSYRLAAFLDN